jgi:hypothetical protein
MGRMEEKIVVLLLYWLHSFPLACLILSINDELVLLTIESKWFEAIIHMTKFEFLDLPCPKQVQLLISIHIHGKFWLSTTYALIDFQKNIKRFISQVEINLKVECFFVFLTIIPTDNVQCSVKHKLDFDESKSISK